MTVAASELPTGTVTFLLTDIESSTELVRRLGDRWPAIAGDHRRLLRAAVREAGGHEVDARGEELFFAFRRAHSAVAAAAAAQHALAEHPWPVDAVVRVRMGVHTGEPVVGDDGGYLGLDVHRTARICAAGHGGQVLCSAATQALVADSDVTFIDLGEQRMRGLEHDERIFQLLVSDAPQHFPPLRSAPVAPFEGLERELGIGALAHVRARVPHFPSLRRREPAARRVAEVCFALRARVPDTPESGRPAVTELARAFVQLSRAAADADRYLARIDRRALAKKLAEARELGVLSKNVARAAERLERQLGLVDVVAGARRELDQSLSEFERRASSLQTRDLEALRGDVETLADHLGVVLDDAIKHVGYAAERLRQTPHRGIYRQGDVWIVPHHDSLGMEHLARFDELREARAFRKRTQLDLKNVEAAEGAALNVYMARSGAHWRTDSPAGGMPKPISGGFGLKLLALLVLVVILGAMFLVISSGLREWGGF